MFERAALERLLLDPSTSRGRRLAASRSQAGRLGSPTEHTLDGRSATFSAAPRAYFCARSLSPHACAGPVTARDGSSGAFESPAPLPAGTWSMASFPNGAAIHPPRPHLLSSPLPSSLPCSRPPLTVPILTVADAVESRPSQRRSRGAFGATSSRWRLSPPTLRAAHADVRLVGSA